jgi:type I restriction enzyme M protein
LTRVLQEVVDVLRSESLVFGLRMATEVNRIVIAKLYDERSSMSLGYVNRFQLAGSPRETAERLKNLYHEAVAGWKSPLVQRGMWMVSHESLAKVVVILEPYYLSSAPYESLSGSFWELFLPLLPRDQAQHFTPPAIGRFLIELAQPTLQDRIIDPACGAGLLLVEAEQYVRGKVEDMRDEGHFDRPIAGIDKNAEVAELAATNLILAGLSPEHVVQADALSMVAANDAEIASDSFDLVLLDPPLGRFGASHLGYTDLDLANRSATTEALFLEVAVTLARPGGRLGLLVPDSLLSSPGQVPVRRWLLAHTVVRAVVSLPPEAFGPVGHTGKASILLLQKRDVISESSLEQAFVADITSVGYDRFGKPIPTNHLPAVMQLYEEFCVTGRLPVTEAEQGPRVWTVPVSSLRADRLDVPHLDPQAHDIAYKLKHSRYPTAKIKEVAEVLSGRTFKHSPASGTGEPVLIQAGAVREFHIDTSAAPVISADDYQKYRRAQVQAGDVLVTTTGQYLGRAAVVEAFEQPAAASGAVTVLRPGPDIDPYFLAAFLNSDAGRQQVASRQASATAQPYIRRGDLGEVLLPLPPFARQREVGQQAHRMHLEASELRQTAEKLEKDAKNLVTEELLEGYTNE